MEAPSPRSHSIRHSYSTGWDLATALASTGRLDERRAAAAVLIPLLQILSERHGKGSVHGDIHPSNVLFSASGRLKLVDLSSAATTGCMSPITGAAALAYMAPELYPSSSSHADDTMQPIYSSPAIDIWAVGVLACELLLGQVPAELARASLGPAPAPAAELELPQELSAEACAFIRAALCRDPRQRPSARKLLKHAWLQAFASEPASALLPGSATSDMQAALQARTNRRNMAKQLQQRFGEPARSSGSSGQPLRPTPLDTITAMLSTMRRPHGEARVRPTSSRSLRSLTCGSGDSLDQSVLIGMRTPSYVAPEEEGHSTRTTPAAPANFGRPSYLKGVSCPATPDDMGRLRRITGEGLSLPHISSPGMSEDAEIEAIEAEAEESISPRKSSVYSSPLFRMTPSKSASPAAAQAASHSEGHGALMLVSCASPLARSQDPSFASPFQATQAAQQGPAAIRASRGAASRSSGSWQVLQANLEARQDALASLMVAKSQRSSGALGLSRPAGLAASPRKGCAGERIDATL